MGILVACLRGLQNWWKLEVDAGIKVRKQQMHTSLLPLSIAPTNFLISLTAAEGLLVGTGSIFPNWWNIV